MLRPLQDIFPASDHPDLLVGLGLPDDAAVWKLDDEKGLVVTTDFFTPVVDTPYDYGAIAAANALSDLYAMGAHPIFALNIAAMPPDLPHEILSEILRGGAEKVREAGAVIAGGHSIQDQEPKYGLVGIGLVPLEELMTKAMAKPGDLLLLTKPLGTGVTTTALKGGQAHLEHVDQVVEWMSRLNAGGMRFAKRCGVKAATDITGFGLLGHAVEIAETSGVGLTFNLPQIPFFEGARKYAEEGYFPSGSLDNQDHFQNRVGFEMGIDEVTQMMLFDAQTSGGLLLAVEWGRLETALEKSLPEFPIWIVGTVTDQEGVNVTDGKLDLDLPIDVAEDGLWFAAA